MPDFKVLSLDHVAITAPEELEDEVVGFYRDVLGLPEVDKPEGTRARGAWFALGASQLHVSVDEHNPHRAAHVGIAVDDYNGVIDALRAAGCHIEQAATIPGRHRFYTRDPAGNRLELVHFDEGDARVAAVEGG